MLKIFQSRESISVDGIGMQTFGFKKEISAVYSITPLPLTVRGSIFIYLINLENALTYNPYSKRSIAFRFTVLFATDNLFVD